MKYGLFGNLDKKVNKLYAGLNPKMAPHIFPDGKEQLKNMLLSLDMIMDGQVSADILLKVYLDTISRFITGMQEDKICESLMKKKYAKNFTVEKVDMIVSYVKITMTNASFTIKTDSDIEIINSLTSARYAAIEWKRINTKLLQSQVFNEHYGLTANNPIYTNGINGSKEYLAQLQTEYIENFNWDRRGSIEVKGIFGVVDQYDLFLPSGKFCKTIYINMYCEENSTVAPKGFMLSLE